MPASGTVTYVKVWTPLTLEINPATNGNMAGKKIRTVPTKGTNGKPAPVLAPTELKGDSR